MKTLFSYAAMAALVLFSSFTYETQHQLNEESVQSATNTCFNYVRGHRQGNGVMMTWGVSNPNVTHFIVEWSDDDYNYYQLESVPKGNSSAHKYLHNTAFPGFNYYKITAVYADGSTECSPTEVVRIVKKH